MSVEGGEPIEPLVARSLEPEKRVAIFLPSLAGGGAERVMLNLALGLARLSMPVELLLAACQGSYRDQLPPGQHVIDFKAKRTLTAIGGLARYLHRVRPRIIISAMEQANLIALAASKLAGTKVPTLFTVHVDLPAYWNLSPLTGGARLVPMLVRRFYPRADAIVAVSHGVANGLRRVATLGDGQLHVIYNPLVSPEPADPGCQATPHPWLDVGTVPVFLGVGRLVPQKDFGALIRAFAEVRRQFPARLIILGEGEERGRLESLAWSLGIGSHVAFPGFVPTPHAYMKRAVAVVLSSRYEGFGNVLVEAMACGTPVVSTDCPSGPAEVLENGLYGPLVPVGDIRRMSDAMLAVLRAPIPGDVLKSRAQAFSIDSIARQYMSLIDLIAPIARRPAEMFDQSPMVSS